MANVPSFVVVLDDGCESDPMTTDCMVELFDFQPHTEQDLDSLLDMDIGETYEVKCWWDNEDPDSSSWRIPVKRVS